VLRRQFLESAIAAAATANAGPPVTLPVASFYGHVITRLILGSNPLYGYSHFNMLLDRLMREWMTQDNRIATLKMAEAAGINTWQVHYNEPTIADWKRYRAEGGKMNVLLLSDFALHKDWTLLREVVKLQPIGVAHHGNRTDEAFRAGQMTRVQEFTKAVHDVGLPAGVSTHNPAVVDYIEERGWDIDYYMTCLYRVTRTAEEARAEFGESPLLESFMEHDPERMIERIRATRKTCFAFKLLGAGRRASSSEQIESVYRYVFSRIKPQDAVIVGMFPKFKNEPRENAELALKAVCSVEVPAT
jgi:hypothetical protein